MVPSKSRQSRSRRSSILKPPKPRQPLQNLNFTSSSNESSPVTSKIKRRVSFAEKKHIKEFCNSLEQGTVWNNTYEEHDLSSQKALSSSGQEEHNAIGNNKENLGCNLEETCSVQDDIVSCVSNEADNKIVNAKDCEVSYTNVVEPPGPMSALLNEKDILQNLPSAVLENSKTQASKYEAPVSVNNTNRISTNIIVYEDTDDNGPDKASECPQLDINTLNCKKLNFTCNEESHMEFTEVVSNALYDNAKCNENNDLRKMIQNTSMEITEAIQGTMSILQEKENIRNLNLHYTLMMPNVEVNEAANCDMSMELTTAVSSIIKSKNNAKSTVHFADDKSEQFVLPMDITAAVSNVPCNIQQSSTNHQEDWNAKSISNDAGNKTVNFNDGSMEITEIIETNIHNSNASCLVNECDKPTLFKNIPNYIDNITNIDKQTKILNLSMEMTTTISDNIYSKTRNQGINTDLALEDDDDRSVNCNELAMNITEVVKSRIHKNTTLVNECDRLTILPNVLEHTDNAANMDERSQLMNLSMEITAAIPTVPMCSVNRNQRINAVSDTHESRYNMNSETLENCDRTRTYNNDSMEFTRAIDIVEPQIYSDNLTSNNRNDDTYIDADKTKIFYNTSMTATAVVLPFNTKDYEEEMMPSELNKNKHDSSKTILFPNTSLEMTEVVGKPQYKLQPGTPVACNEIKQLELYEKLENNVHELNLSSATDNALKDTADSVVPSSLNLDTESGKGESTINDNTENFEVRISKRIVVEDAQETVNVIPSIALHELNHQDALALKENNTGIAYAQFNHASGNACTAANSMLNQSKCLQQEELRNIVFNPRRTYTVDKLKIDHTCTTANVDRNVILKINNCHEVNSSEAHTHAELNDNLERNLQDEENLILNESLENLESVNPPSFLCLDDTVDTDIGADLNCNEINAINTENVETLNPKCDEQENSVLKCKDQTLSNEFEVLQSKSCTNSITTEPEILEYSSSSIDVSEKSSKQTNATNFPNVNELRSISRETNTSGESFQLYLDSSCLSNSRFNIDKNLFNEMDMEMVVVSKENSLNLVAKGNVECQTSTQKDVSVILDPFSSLMKELKVCAESDDIIWNVYHENIERKMFVIGFMSCSLLVVIHLMDGSDAMSIETVKEIKVISRLADEADALISMVHRIILEKLDTNRLMNLYKRKVNILSMLDHVSKEVKTVMDFMFDVKRSYDLNLMEITHDSISFISWTTRADIVLKIVINIKSFDLIESQDISVQCLLGSVREEDIKKLLTNIKRDHKFLRRFMNDVRHYIYLMEESVIKTSH